MLSRHPRLWSSGFKFSLAVLALAGIVVITAIVTARKDGPVWPAVAAAVALTGVVVTSAGVLANYRRQKRQETLDAWNAWSDASATARAANFKTFGSSPLREAQARALVLIDGALHDADGNELSGLERRQAARNISHVLNGLESLGAGVYHGVYDIKMLHAAGYTIITSTKRRFNTYIDLRRSTTEENKRQRSAFEALCVLADHLETLERRSAKRRSDRGVLAYFRGHR